MLGVGGKGRRLGKPHLASMTGTAILVTLLSVYLLPLPSPASAISTDVKVKFNDDWYKSAAEDMKKPPPATIYSRGKGAAYLGIPYAQPPKGSHAFSPPQPIDSKREYGKMRTFPGMPERSFFIGEQDCLTLNVMHPPKPRNTSFLYPVYVVLHGGDGFLLSGSAREFGLQGLFENFVSRGVVVVTVEYRLGTYGLFNFGTGGEGDSLRSLRDVLMAVRWVNAYIDNFHGDPQAVTLGGWGGGACLVSSLILAATNRSNGISHVFQQADVHSGGMILCEQLLWSRVEKNASEQIAAELCGSSAKGGAMAVRQCVERQCICTSTDSKHLCGEKTRKCVQAAQTEPGDGELFRFTAYTSISRMVGGKKAEGVERLSPNETHKMRIMRSWTSDEWATLHTQYVLEHWRRHMQPGEQVHYNKQYLRDMFMRITKLDLVEKNASASFDRLYSLYAAAYNFSDESTELQWYKFYVMFFTKYLFSVPALYDTTHWHYLGHEVFIYEFADNSGHFLPDATAAKFKTRVVGHAGDLPYVFMPEHYLKPGAHNVQSLESALLGEWRLADAMGHMMADFVWLRPMKAAFKPINPYNVKFYTTRIDRQQGFAQSIEGPFADKKIFSAMYQEWYCNFRAQFGEELSLVEEKRCASYTPN